MIAWLRAGTAALLLAGSLVKSHEGLMSTEASSTQNVTVCSSEIQVNFAQGPLDLSRTQVMEWVQTSAASVATYFGRFPVLHMRVQIVPAAGERGIVSGTTWGSPTVHTRMVLGEHATLADLHDDWVMTHEFVHTSLPQLEENHHWMEEGLATYIEPIARVQHGVLSEESVWADMIRDMPKGEPAAGDRGLDRTHTWARTYWGGAMFYLVADVRIRQLTNGRKGLQDALRALVANGQTIAVGGTPEENFAQADRATGVSVLLPLYREVREQPVQEDLDALWASLGVRKSGRAVRYEDKAPLASVRAAIFRPQPMCGGTR